jgi:hypothetical protein
MSLVTWSTRIAEQTPIPDMATRAVMARFVAHARRQLAHPPSDVEARFAAQMFDLPIADHVHDTKAQHHVLPPAFMREFLGPRLDYACAPYKADAETLGDAEVAALVLLASGGGETGGVSRYRLKHTGALG